MAMFSISCFPSTRSRISLHLRKSLAYVECTTGIPCSSILCITDIGLDCHIFAAPAAAPAALSPPGSCCTMMQRTCLYSQHLTRSNNRSTSDCFCRRHKTLTMAAGEGSRGSEGEERTAAVAASSPCRYLLCFFFAATP
jgi:hypothetical protein